MEAEDGAKQASELHAAVADNNLPLVQQLLSDNASQINKRNRWDQLPLYVVDRNANADIVGELLKHGASRDDIKWKIDCTLLNGELLSICCLMQLPERIIRNVTTYRGETVLHNAVSYGNLEVVEYLLSRIELCVDVVNKQGETPLLRVCNVFSNTDTSLRIFRLLLANGADIYAKTYRGDTVLHTAVRYEHLEVVEYLVSRKELCVDVVNKQDKTPLHQVPLHVVTRADTSLRILRLLLANGADINAQHYKGDTVLHKAVKYDNLEVVEYLVSRKELCVDVVNKEGRTPLHAAFKGSGKQTSFRILQLLLANGADINAQTNIGWTPLHYACNMSEPVPTVRELLSNGAKLDMADFNGDYPIHFLRFDELFDPSTLLLNSGDISSLKDAKGRTILHIAAETKNKYVVENIVTKSSCVNNPDNIGKTPLHYAVLNSESGVTSCLIANGANIDAVDTWGQTALHEAARVDNVDALKVLLADSCDVNVTDVTGVTALHVACLNNSVMCLDLLLSNWADIKCCDNNKSSPLHFAAWNDTNNPVLIDLLLKECVDIFQKDDLGHTCLDIAVFRRNCKIYSALTEHTQISHTSELDNELPSVASIKIGSNFLTLPGVGRGTDEDEAKEIQAAIEDMIQTLAERIGHVDPRFKCVVLHAGSMSEGTKTILPDEFDFLFCLEEFSKRCESNYTPNEVYADGVLAVRIKDDAVSFAFKEYSCSNFMSHFDINRVFSELVTKTIFDNTFPKHPQLMPIYINTNPSLKVRWRGAMYKQLDIHIDIVPAILLPHWHETTRKESVLMTSDMLRIPCIAVAKQVSNEGKDWRIYDDFWRSSMALVETCILRKLRPEIRNSYIACKALASSRIRPVIGLHERDGTVVQIVSSYIIKMSFLLVVEKKANRDGLDSVYSKPTTGNAMNVDENPLNQSNEQKDETVRSDKDRVQDKQETMHGIFYGPASTMNVAVQNADFDMELVREVFQRLEEGFAIRYLPSIFNARVNVLGNMFNEYVDEDDIEEINLYMKLIRKLIE